MEEFKENEQKGIIRIAATVLVERKSHKGIVIGKQGEMLKTVGNQARLELEAILGTKIFLELWVKVKEKWSENESLIREIRLFKLIYLPLNTGFLFSLNARCPSW